MARYSFNKSLKLIISRAIWKFHSNNETHNNFKTTYKYLPNVLRTHIEADGCWSRCSFWSNCFPYEVWTHAFCTWIEPTDGLVAQGQGVTLLHRVTSALLNYLEAMLHASRCFCKYPEAGSTSKVVTKTNCTVEGNNLILKVFMHTLQILQKTPSRPLLSTNHKSYLHRASPDLMTNSCCFDSHL